MLIRYVRRRGGTSADIGFIQTHIGCPTGHTNSASHPAG